MAAPIAQTKPPAWMQPGAELEHSEDSRMQHNIRQSKIIKLFQKCTSETTIHGIRYIFENNIIFVRRILWILVVLACAAICTFQFYTRATTYMSKSESVNLDVVVKNEMNFPRVIICNKNLFKMTMLKEYRSFILGLFDIESIEPNPEKQTYYLDRVNSKLTNLTEEYIKRGHRLQDMIVKCYFAGTKCSSDNFTVVITDNGICYQFNGDGTPLTVNNPGMGTGLMLAIDAEHYDYSSSFQNSAGIYLSIQAPNEALPMRETALTVAVGFETLIGLELTEMVANPVGDCSSKRLKYHTMYSVTACRLECLTDYVVQNCGCKGNYMPGDTPECRFNLQFTCVQFFAKNFTQSEAGQSCVCPVACTKQVYAAPMSSAPISSPRARSLALDIRTRNKLNVKEDWRAKYNVISKLPTDQKMLYSITETSETLIQAMATFCSKLDNYTSQLNDLLASRPLSPDLFSSIEAAWNVSIGLIPVICNNSMLLNLAESNLEAKFWLLGRDELFNLLQTHYAAHFHELQEQVRSSTKFSESRISDYISITSFGSDKCRVMIAKTKHGGTVTFPPYGEYQINANCTWEISVRDPNHNLIIAVDWKSIEASPSCERDALEIRQITGALVQTVCDSTGPLNASELQNNRALLIFRSNEAVVGRGFSVTYYFKQRVYSDQFNAWHIRHMEGGRLTYPTNGKYLNNADCTWEIGTDDVNMNIELTIEWKDIKDSRPCVNDSLDIRLMDGTTLMSFCGSNPEGPIVLPYNRVTLAFRSDATEVGNGVCLNYTFIEPPTPACISSSSQNAEGGSLEFSTSGQLQDNISCTWYIATGNPQANIEMVLKWKDIECNDSCQHDALEIRLFDNTFLHTIHGGSDGPESISLPYYRVKLKFKSNRSNSESVDSGFYLTYTPLQKVYVLLSADSIGAD